MSWIGGDLAGLQGMGTTMKGATGLTEDVVKALGSQTDKIVGDVGWSGNAADLFRKAWTMTSVQMSELATVTGSIGTTIGDLGDKLQHIEGDLYNAAQQAKGKGAQIGDDGKPLPLVITGNPDSAEAKQAREAQQDYTDAYTSAIGIAQGFRLQAAKSITDTMNNLKPNKGDVSGKDNTDYENWTTGADYLRGLYAVPNEKNSEWAKKLPDEIKTTTAGVDKAQADLRTAFDKYYADNKTMPIDDPARTNFLSAVGDLRQQQAMLADAEAGRGEQPLSKMLNTKIGDVGKLFPKFGGDMPEGLKFLKDIPVVDIAASGVVAEFQAQDDMQKGWGATTARALDYTAAGVGVAAGVGAGAVLSTVGAPAAAIAADGGFAVVGVGDAVYEGFHEDWDEDIDNRGWVSGVTHGLGHTFSNTGGDIVGIGKSMSHLATGLWHKVF